MKRLLSTIVAVCLFGGASATIVLPKVLGSNMVLQQQSEVNLWGKGHRQGQDQGCSAFSEEISHSCVPLSQCSFLRAHFIFFGMTSGAGIFRRASL